MKTRIAKGKMKGHRATLHGGPWNMGIVFIPDGGTMVFRVGPWHGSYDHQGRWVNLDGQP